MQEDDTGPVNKLREALDAFDRHNPAGTRVPNASYLRIVAAARAVADGERWDWCGYHKTHPMVSWDPAGDPYCWVGYWRGEGDACSSVAPLRVWIARENPNE